MSELISRIDDFELKIMDKKEVLKNLLCKDLTNAEFEVFLHACIRTRLDPFMKQIYAIRRKLHGKEMMSIQTGIDGFRLIAERTGRYSPGRESTFTYSSNGGLESATSYIKKMTDDGTWHEIAATAYFSEYNPNQGLWGKMPRVMLAKCAESQALRKAFPAELSGIYTKEEMDQDQESVVSVESEIQDGPLTEQQVDEIDMMLEHTENSEKFRQKIEEVLKIDSIFSAKQSQFPRIKNYFQNLISNQQKKREMDEQVRMA